MHISLHGLSNLGVSPVRNLAFDAWWLIRLRWGKVPNLVRYQEANCLAPRAN